jgi:hypothetical protein
MPPDSEPTIWMKLAQAGSYLFCALIGVSVFLWPPVDSVTHTLAYPFAVYTWSAFILSSILCVPATILGKWRVEYLLIPFFTTALIVAVVSVWLRAGGDPLAIPRACTATALIFAFIARFMTLNRIVNAGKRAARRVMPWTPR